MNNQTARGLRKDAAEARKTAQGCRQAMGYQRNIDLMERLSKLAAENEARAQELDRQADALDGGKPTPWWRLLPIPWGGE